MVWKSRSDVPGARIALAIIIVVIIEVLTRLSSCIVVIITIKRTLHGD